MRIIICVPIQFESVRGSIVRQCGTCKGDVWVAPTSMADLKEGDEMMCLDCVPPDLFTTGEFGGFFPGQIEEVRRYLKEKGHAETDAGNS